MSAALAGLAVLLLGLVFLALIPPRFDDKMPKNWSLHDKK